MNRTGFLYAGFALSAALLCAFLATSGSRAGARGTPPDAPQRNAALPAASPTAGSPTTHAVVAEGHADERRTLAGAVSGRVVDEAGAALAQARVRCAESEVLTDDTGRFDLTCGAAGKLHVVKEGYRLLEETIPPGAVELGDLVLHRVQLVVEGRVLDPDRKPAAEASVRIRAGRALEGETRDAVLDALYRPGEPAQAPIAQTTADAEGAFRLELTELAQPLCVEAQSETGEGRRLITVGAAEQSVFVVLDLTPVSAVRGRVVDAAGNGLAGLPIVVAPFLSDDGEGSEALAWKRSATSGADGRFRAEGVPLRPATLAVWGPGGQRELVRFGQPFPEELTVVISGAGELVGSVLEAETRKPILGAVVSALAEGENSSRVTWVTARSDEAGRFTLRGLPPGPVKTLIVRHDAHPPAGTILGGSLPTPVVLEPPARSEPVEVLLPQGVDLELLVRAPAGAPVGGARVRLDGHGALVRRQGETDGEGRARFEALLAGPYLLDVETSAGVVALEQRLVYVHPELEAVSVDLVPESYATGRVVTENDTPLSGVDVVLRTLAQSGLGVVDKRQTFSDAVGRFQFAGLAPGSLFEIEAVPPGRVGATAVGLVEVPGQLVDVGSITVLQGAEVLGTVTDQDGAAVAGAEVRLLRPLSPASPPASTWTGDDGTFAFVGLDPGRVQPVATLAGHLPSIQPSFVLEPGEQRADMVIVVRRGEVLCGSVLDGYGVAVAGAEVAARWVPLMDDAELVAAGPLHTKKLELFCQERAVVTAEGTFSLEGLPSDRPLQIRVLASGFAVGAEIVQPLTLRGTGDVVILLHEETDS